MAGRRLFLILILVMALGAHANAASLPIIVQIAPLSNITTIANSLGATVVDSIPGTSIYLLNVPVAPPSSLLALLGIQWVEVNTSVSLPNFNLPGLISVPGATPVDWYKNQAAWQLIRAGQALSYSRGGGVVVADINSAVDYAHPALRGHLTSGWDFVSSKPQGYGVLDQSDATALDQSDATALDQSDATALDEAGGTLLQVGGLNALNPAYSHGTLTVGVIAAIAPDSMVMPLRTFDDEGKTDLFMIAKAIRWAVNGGAHVINMSFGTLTDSKAIRNAIDHAKNRGVVLVASAGNRNTSEVQYPAGYSGVLTTAAIDLLEKKGSFSNYGSYVVVDAPGVNIISPYPGGYYSVTSGTSFSAPAVAGTAALVRSLRATGIAGSITGNSVNIDNKNPNYANQLGYGRIDVLEAVKPN